MKITIEKLKQLGACGSVKTMFAENFGREAELADVVEWAIAQGGDAIKHADWLLPRCLNRDDMIRYAVYAAELALPIFEAKYPADKRPRFAIEAAKKCVKDKSIEAAAHAAAATAYAARAAARAAYAAYAASAADATATARAAADAAYAAAAYAANADKTLAKILRFGLEIIDEENKGERF